MNCAEIEKDLELFLTGKLSGERAGLVRSHLASCRQCASRLSAPDRIEALVALDETVEPSDSFAASFRARLETHRLWQGQEKARHAGLWRRLLGWSLPKQLAAAGAVAALLALGVYLGILRTYPPAPAATVTEINIAEILPLLEDMAVITNLDLLEDFDAIQSLNETQTKPSGTQ